MYNAGQDPRDKLNPAMKELWLLKYGDFLAHPIGPFDFRGGNNWIPFGNLVCFDPS